MPRKPAPLLPPHPCDGTYPDPVTGQETRCQNTVAPRKPSKSGYHFCPRKSCQATKQRLARARQLSEARSGEASEVHELVLALRSNQRTTCHACGLADALVGWIHSAAPTPNAGCTALGNRGRALPPGTLRLINDDHPKPVEP